MNVRLLKAEMIIATAGNSKENMFLNFFVLTKEIVFAKFHSAGNEKNHSY
jgi:hypothetical protein